MRRLVCTTALLAWAACPAVAAPQSGPVWEVHDSPGGHGVVSGPMAQADGHGNSLGISCRPDRPDVYLLTLDTLADKASESQITAAMASVHGLVLAPKDGRADESLSVIVPEGFAKRSGDVVGLSGVVARGALARLAASGRPVTAFISGDAWTAALGDAYVLPLDGLMATLSKMPDCAPPPA